ncbi:uncharacterized protein PFL1_06355 [Pseudozyma flocculosa PF-1]|uniref:Uncharacterized protein n=2 Tax=Pseudozyma flocculosa TaxID=84751 RepID=A0A5C3F9R9_9BASI|nr:uncharacterized protein PFL1_06355 [Pseudozyma flocculosa PF-1]EPQ26147.1 hypothetical protein PFL1_06355 [Pseudozyma flocculosa PF-1]SPO40395.1 uncharacterized protein PSFLO_05877 [Pseudozyma flocculosa]
MGNCASKSNAVVEVAAPPPHPQARKMTLIAVPLDQQQIPVDLAGIDSGGLKAAMHHRGLETEHWALKVDPVAGQSASAQVFDISVERDGMVTSIQDINSPMWRGICRRQELGWTLWNDAEILHATKMLVKARPKYDGRSNNLQQLARILAKHIHFTPSAVAETASSGSVQKLSAPPSHSTEQSHTRHDSIELSSERPTSAVPMMPAAGTTTSSSPAGSIRQGSQGRSRLSHLPRSSSTAEINETVERPPLNRASLSEQQAQRLQANRRSSAFAGSPLNPEKKLGDRARTQSDIAQSDKRASRHPREQSREDRRRSTLSQPQMQSQPQSQSQSRRKSQIPAEWAGEAYRGSDSQAGGSAKRMSRRQSQMDFVAPPMPHSGTWSPAFAPPTPPMLAMPVSPYDLPPPGMSPYMAGYTVPMSGSMHSLHGPYQQQHQQQPSPHMAMARPMSFYGPPTTMPWGMPPPPPMMMLNPPSPGGYNASMNSSMVPTPPESPLPPLDPAAGKQLKAPPADYKLGQSRSSPTPHSRHASAR